MSRINVLMIVGNGENSLGGTRAELAGESSPDGIRVSVFDSLDELPPFSEAAATVELPGSVDALRNAAATADARVARDALLRACTRDRAQRHRLADDVLEWY